MADRLKFHPSDLDVLESVIDAVPNLRAVAHATSLVRARCAYPIGDHKELSSAFDGKKKVVVDDREVALEEAELFLPDVFFPIASERDLVCKLLIAFQIGDLYHATEAARQMPAEDETPVTILPGPVFHRVNKKDLVRARRKRG